MLQRFVDVNSAIGGGLPAGSRVQQLRVLQTELIEAGDKVAKNLEPDLLLAHGLFVSVDQTQGKVKPSWPLETLAT